MIAINPLVAYPLVAYLLAPHPNLNIIDQLPCLQAKNAVHLESIFLLPRIFQTVIASQSIQAREMMTAWSKSVPIRHRHDLIRFRWKMVMICQLMSFVILVSLTTTVTHLRAYHPRDIFDQTTMTTIVISADRLQKKMAGIHIIRARFKGVCPMSKGKTIMNCRIATPVILIVINRIEIMAVIRLLLMTVGMICCKSTFS
mmetsp:Transcript_36229/g.36459  ORF Transcript_36229/g.36459 Transcript_36229/m.36459 type:complete len:200 (+) Transcript_36229:350-949(+)